MWKIKLFAKDSYLEVADRLILFLNENKIKEFNIIQDNKIENSLIIIYK